MNEQVHCDYIFDIVIAIDLAGDIDALDKIEIS